MPIGCSTWYFFKKAQARKNGGQCGILWAEASFFHDFFSLFYQEKRVNDVKPGATPNSKQKSIIKIGDRHTE